VRLPVTLWSKEYQSKRTGTRPTPSDISLPRTNAFITYSATFARIIASPQTLPLRLLTFIHLTYATHASFILITPISPLDYTHIQEHGTYYYSPSSQLISVIGASTSVEPNSAFSRVRVLLRIRSTFVSRVRASLRTRSHRPIPPFPKLPAPPCQPRAPSGSQFSYGLDRHAAPRHILAQ
jgi:hypothetical protein